MKYFLIEGIVTHPEKDDGRHDEGAPGIHRWPDEGRESSFSSLKNDMSTSVTVVRAEDEKIVWEFYKKSLFI